MGGPGPLEVDSGPGRYKKQADHAMEGKVGAGFLHGLWREFLPWSPSVMDCEHDTQAKQTLSFPNGFWSVY